MKHTIFRLTFAAALTLGTAAFWQIAQPASANEYICRDRNSGDWFTTDRNQSGDRGNITCRERDSSSDRQNRDRNYSTRDHSDWNYSTRDQSNRDYPNRDNSSWDSNGDSNWGYSGNDDSRDSYARGYDDACAHNAPESLNSRGYAEGYRDGLQRCDRPQRWNRNAAH
jgi:hypothetical protein